MLLTGYFLIFALRCFAICDILVSKKGRDFVKEKTANFTFRIPDDLRDELQKRADVEGRTLSNYIIYLLRKAVKE